MHTDPFGLRRRVARPPDLTSARARVRARALHLPATVSLMKSLQLQSWNPSPGCYGASVSGTESDSLTFAWDRPETVSSLQEKLRTASAEEWLSLAAWILREAQPAEVWRFLRPEDVAARLPQLVPFLGRRREFWTYLIRTWHELGKL